MACNSCSTSDGGAPKGCKNNGTCGTDSCNKLTVFDWLANMSLPSGQEPFDCVEVRFKNGRKEFYRNTEKLTLSIGDIVATEASPGHDIGIVTLTGELVRIQMKKKGVSITSPEITKIYRKASQKDIDIWSNARDKEEPMKVRARELAISHKLEMKISDIEFQGDGSKATFYYTANDRVDFRLLIKDFAKAFSARIEMKQVGFRQEASRLGGIGSCGRELCCSTWLTDFRSVNTSAARYQQLSLNPQKLAGQCGKLKCCLNYELDTYMDALQDFPSFDTKLVTEKGEAICQKQDIFKGLMWFAYTNNFAQWHVLKIEQVREIIEENKLKNKVSSLEDYALEIVTEPEKDFNNAMGQESLTRFDQPTRKKKNNKKRKPSGDKKPNPASGNGGNNNNNNNPRPAANKIIPVNRNEPKE
jgi:cell fate regulator YaaT (PSP1 superfamily)